MLCSSVSLDCPCASPRPLQHRQPSAAGCSRRSVVVGAERLFSFYCPLHHQMRGEQAIFQFSNSEKVWRHEATGGGKSILPSPFNPLHSLKRTHCLHAAASSYTHTAAAVTLATAAAPPPRRPSQHGAQPVVDAPQHEQPAQLGRACGHQGRRWRQHQGPGPGGRDAAAPRGAQSAARGCAL